MNYRRWLGLVLFLLIVIPLQIKAVAMQADTSSVEWIKIYFNMPAGYSEALPGNMSKSNSDMIGTLETIIQNAGHSVDLAIYDLEHPRIREALAEAQNRGVRV